MARHAPRIECRYSSEFMFISQSHESGHCPKEKLVVSPAFNQVVQSLFDRLLRLSYSAPLGSINQSPVQQYSTEYEYGIAVALEVRY